MPRYQLGSPRLMQSQCLSTQRRTVNNFVAGPRTACRMRETVTTPGRHTCLPDLKLKLLDEHYDESVLYRDAGSPLLEIANKSVIARPIRGSSFDGTPRGPHHACTRWTGDCEQVRFLRNLTPV